MSNTVAEPVAADRLQIPDGPTIAEVINDWTFWEYVQRERKDPQPGEPTMEEFYRYPSRERCLDNWCYAKVRRGGYTNTYSINILVNGVDGGGHSDEWQQYIRDDVDKARALSIMRLPQRNLLLGNTGNMPPKEWNEQDGFGRPLLPQGQNNAQLAPGQQNQDGFRNNQVVQQAVVPQLEEDTEEEPDF